MLRWLRYSSLPVDAAPDERRRGGKIILPCFAPHVIQMFDRYFNIF